MIRKYELIDFIGCSPGEFACDVSRCILASHRCNFIKECDDGSDEHDCSYPGKLFFSIINNFIFRM